MSIGVISPYPEFTDCVQKIAKESTIEIKVKEGALNRGLYNARRLIEEHGVSVIIARGATADLLESELEIPIVKITFNNYDLMKVFNEAKKTSKEIFFIDHYKNEVNTDLSFIEESLSIIVHLKQYIDEREIQKQIDSISRNHSVLVGTAECVAKSGKAKGLQVFIVTSSTVAITEALTKAKEISGIYEKEKTHQQYLETIISHAFEGVISTDIEGKITIYNKIAEQVLGIKKTDVVSRFMKKISHPNIRKLYGDGQAVTKTIVSLGEKRYVVNRIPLEKHSDSLVITFQEIDKLMELNSEVRSYLSHHKFNAKHSFKDIIHESCNMEKTIQIAHEYSKSNSSVLLQGESGVGKELFAQSIHNASLQNEGPFIAINCATLPGNLLESELFGYEEGSFTGAKKGGKPGLFEMAHRGTLFLDEIGELPLELQSRLLRALQEKEVMRVGGQKIIPVDVRIISASNKDLFTLTEENNFREDLYYRLNVLQVRIPPLRERKEDIPVLLRYLWNKNYSTELKLSSKLWSRLLEYNWPGNIRELENVIERIHILSKNMDLYNDDFIFNNKQQRNLFKGNFLEIEVGSLKDIEKQVIEYLHEKYEGNKQKISEVLGVSRTTLWKKLSVEKEQ